MQDLSKLNRDYATFLPAISGFYAGMLARPQERVPAGFERGVQGLDFLQPDGYFHYNKALYSAGHAYLDLEKSINKESMVWTRDRDKTVLVSDSGGFQIGKGVIKFDWERFYEKKGNKGYKGDADRVRQNILTWQEHISEWSMVLDVPGWATNRPETGIRTFQDCLDATLHNNDFYVANRTPGMTKFLNVLQGGDWEQAQLWYDAVKDYPFEGWGMGGQNMCDMEIVLKRLIIMRDEGKLDGKDWIHFLGTSRMDWACMLTLIQRQLRQHINPNVTISFDCASPFVAVANGLTYTAPVHMAEKWTYVMESGPDNKVFKNSTIPYPFQSAIADRLSLGDICVYGPGDLNKIGKEGKTSWDSFSYCLIMAHNVYQHIRAVQIANNIVDIEAQNHRPSLQDWKKLKGKSNFKEASPWVPRNILYFATFIEELFSSSKPMTMIEDYKSFLRDVSNSSNKKGNSAFDDIFEASVVEADDSVELDDAKLEILEEALKEETI